MAAFEIGVRGYIPTVNTTVELAVDIIHLVRDGGTFVPPSSLSVRAARRQGAAPAATLSEEFTARQKEVLDRLRQGKTNKLIAYDLHVSESTVKAHIRNIMEKLHATNRTEVASRAHELEMSETRKRV
jgi:DNA-binding NarL/FixJ family response regulator